MLRHLISMVISMQNMLSQFQVQRRSSACCADFPGYGLFRNLVIIHSQHMSKPSQPLCLMIRSKVFNLVCLLISSLLLIFRLWNNAWNKAKCQMKVTIRTYVGRNVHRYFNSSLSILLQCMRQMKSLDSTIRYTQWRSATSVARTLTVKPGFHYPSWRPELTVDRFPLPVNSGRQLG